MAKVTKKAAPKKATKAKKVAKAENPAAPVKAAAAATTETRLALDRFLMGLWTDRDLTDFLASKRSAAKPLQVLAGAANTERQREGEKLRLRLFGRDRPTDLEKFEALLKQGVDCVKEGMPVLSELQHDMQANVDIVGREDLRAQAMRALAEYAMASQVNVAIQTMGRLAEVTTDRVSRARGVAIAKLDKLLAGFEHLRP